MRKALGILLLLVGIPALWWYAAGNNGREMEQIVTRGAIEAAEQVRTSVSGRDIEVSGFVADEEERNSILSSLDAVEGRRVVRDRTELLPSVSPYEFSAQKTAEGISASGYIPSETARSELAAMADNTSELELASGAPDGWSGVAASGLSALAALETGRLEMVDNTVTLSGTAKTRADGEKSLAAVDNLPAGYTLNSNLEYLERGNPEFTLLYSSSDGAVLNGEIPKGLTREAIANALKLDELPGDAQAGSWGDPDRTRSALDRLSEWLPEIESLKFQSVDDGFELVVTALPGTDLPLLKTEMAQAMGENVAVSVSVASDLPPEGTTRVNAATGETEVMTDGHWLPQFDFQPDFSRCQEYADTLLSEREVNFVTASAQLDAKSLRVINAIASLVRKCVEAGALGVEVAGHTDSQGDADFNQQLSADRAQSVVAALIERGVPETAIVAAGYGETRPIADNETEEGRAANRRVVLVFSELQAN